MYHHIRGEVVELGPGRVVLEAAGVGYELAIPFSTYSAITTELEGDQEGAPLCLLTHHYVREDVCKLFGFSTEAERVVFRAVLGISGLGPTAALTLLSSVRADEFRTIVEAGDPKPLERVKGIGKRLASRLVVELKDRLEALSAVTPGASSQAVGTKLGSHHLTTAASVPRSEAVTALVGLGYAEKEAETRVDAALRSLGTAAGGPESGGAEVASADGDDESVTLEALLYESLRQR